MMSTSLLPEKEVGRVYLPSKAIWELADQLRESGICFVQSSHSLFVPSRKVKYISQADCSYWLGLDGRSYLMTPGEIARTELEKAFGKPFISVRKNDLKLLDFPPPQYYDGRVVEGKLFYVDINSAYHQIYTYLTLDLAWPRGLGNLWLKPVADRVAGNKLARNAVVGISRSRIIFMDTPQGSKRMYFRNHFLSPALWRTIQSILHEVATTAIMEGSFYVATDGYLFDNPVGFDRFTGYLRDVGLSFKTEEGQGYCRGWASYKVGKKETKVKARAPRKIEKVDQNEKGTVSWWTMIKESHCR